MSQLITVGKYHVLERLGDSSLAEIYRVKTVGIAGFEKVQVLHRILPHYAEDPAFLREFIAQAKIAFSLNHRNIVQVFEFGKIDGELFLATEYIPGVSLRDVIEESRRRSRIFPVGLTCYLMSEVAAGLEYAHKKSDQMGNPLDIVHCDVSPLNIACSWEGSVKVLDFGLARTAWLAVDPDTRHRAVLPCYASPEQVGGEDLTHTSDLFGFGVVLWELLTGRPLFDGSSAEEVMQAIVEAPISAPRSLNREVPPDLDDLVVRCLARDPGQRAQSASDLQLELHRIQRDVGAVIGSRTLATLLKEILSEHSESRDVRQRFRTTRRPSRSVARSRETIHHLVDAATELAERPTRPALRLAADDTSTTRRKRRESNTQRRTELNLPERSGADHSSDIDERGDSWERPSASANKRRPPQQPSRETRSAGVLRAQRFDEDDDVAATGSSSGLRESDSMTATSPPMQRSPSAPNDAEPTLATSNDSATRARQASLPTRDPEAPAGTRSASARGTDEVRNQQRLAMIESDADIIASSEDASGLLSEPDDDPVSGLSPAPALGKSESEAQAGSESPRPLGEKKRFIAACVLLDGPEDLRRDALDLIADIAYKLDGLVHERETHRLVALFGLPTADENDIVAAVRFGFDAREAVSHLRSAAQGKLPSDALEEHLSIGVGIRAGTARMSGPPSRAGYQTQGNAIAQTSLLAENAADGQLYAAGAAARLASLHYTLSEIGTLRARGKPVRCYRIVGPQSAQRRHDASASPLVGREMEIKALRTAWRETVMGGCQQSVLILGEPGVGKTRLVDEFLLRHCSDARVVMAAATPHRRESPNGVLVDVLRGIAGEWPTSDTPRSRARLVGSLRQLCEHAPGHVRDQLEETLQALLNPANQSLEARGDFSRRRLYQVIRQVLDHAAEHRPLVLVIEDLHWGDSSSIECLRALTDLSADARASVFLLMTARPGEGTDFYDLFPTSSASHILLDELDEGDRRSLIEGSLGDDVPADLVLEVERRAGGNPFYIRELCQELRELNIAASADIPASVQGVINSRVDRLPAFAKAVLQHAAVLGPNFREVILTLLLARNPARPLAELRNRGFLVPSVAMAPYGARNGSRSERVEREWMFRHVLVQEVIYDAIRSADRRDLHGKVGKIMLERADKGATDSPAEVARHLELGGAACAAAEYYIRAAAQAAGGYANKEAIRLYDRALRLSANDPTRQHAAYAGRERIYARLGLHDKQAADLRALAQLCGDDPNRRADLHIRETLRRLRLGEFYQALEKAEEAESAAKAADNKLLQGEALRLRGEAYERLNDHPRAIATVEKSLKIFETLGARSHQARARIGLGRVLLVQARYDEALAHFSPALALIEQSADRWQERILRNNLSVVHFCRGDLARALEEALFSLRLCIEFGDRAREGDNSSVVGIVYLELGMYALARTYLERALDIHRETRSRWSEADTLVYAGTLETVSGDYRKAAALLTHGKSIADQIGAKYIAINARNGLGLMLCERSQSGDAARAVEETTEAFEAAGQTALIVGEIPGLSRAARATALLGNLEGAKALSRRAVELLKSQRHIEGPEQEIYYTHYRVLSQLEAANAADYLELAHASFADKLALIEDPEQRQSFSKNVPLNRAIQRDFRSMTGDDDYSTQPESGEEGTG